MSKRDLQAAFAKETQRLPRPVPLASPGTGTSDLAIPAYQADGAAFRVLFAFTAPHAGLSRIQLSAPKPAESTCADVEKRITDEHGAPAGRSTTETSIRVQEVVWKLPDQTITLACSEKPSLGFREVALDYAPAEAPAAPAAAPSAATK
jgi:hypothetical protein